MRTLICAYGVFVREREIFAKEGNVKKMAKSNIRIPGSKSSPTCAGVRQLFAGVVFSSAWIYKKFEISCKRFQHPANNWWRFRTPAHVWQAFGALNTNVGLGHFFRHSHPLRIVHVPVKTLLYRPSSFVFYLQLTERWEENWMRMRGNWVNWSWNPRDWDKRWMTMRLGGEKPRGRRSGSRGTSAGSNL